MERRREPRWPASGEVKLRSEGPAPVADSGRLVDTAEGGFRAVHGLQALAPGQTVAFAYAGVHGRARVVWTRIFGEQVESGFLILKL